jgi:hypothetical protein
MNISVRKPEGKKPFGRIWEGCKDVNIDLKINRV